MPAVTVQITERALLQRVRRHLSKEGLHLFKSRPGLERTRFGEYFVRDDGGVDVQHVPDLVTYARELGVTS